MFNPSLQFLVPLSRNGAGSVTGMNSAFRENLFRMLYSLPADIRGKVNIISGYRSPEHQAQLFQAAIRKYGSVEAARKWVAPPGRSRHNMGLAADLGFDGSGLSNAPSRVIQYLHEIAPKFNLNFPLSNENWHIEQAGARGNGISVDSSTNTLIGSAGKDTIPSANPYADLIRKAAAQYGIDPKLLYSQDYEESRFNPRAISPAGARGIAQFMPGTAKALGVNPDDPESSIMGQAKFMKQLLDKYNSNPSLALAAYNAGPGTVDKVNGDISKLPLETQNYIKKILALAPQSGGLGAQAAAGAADLGGLAADMGSIATAGPELVTRRLLEKIPGKSEPIDPAYAQFVSPDMPITPKAWEPPPELYQPEQHVDGGPSPTQDLADLADWAHTKADEIAGGPPQGFLQSLVRGTPTGLSGGPIGMGIAGLNAGVASAPPLDEAMNKQVTDLKKSMNEGYPSFTPTNMEGVDPLSVGEPTGSPFTADEFNLNSLGEGANFLADLFAGKAFAGDDKPLVPPAGNPAIDKKAWETIGPMSLLSAGFMFAPGAVKLLSKLKPTRIDDLPLSAGPAGLKSIVTGRDYKRTVVDDVWAGIFNGLKRVGADPQLLREASQAATVETRSGAIALADSMLKNGVANAMAGTFSVSNPLSVLRAISAKEPRLAQYLQLWNTIDDLASSRRLTVRGLTRAQAMTEIHNLERQLPELTQWRSWYQENLQAYRDFITQGQYGLMSNAQKAQFLALKPNEIPHEARSLDHIDPDEPDPIDLLATNITFKVRNRLDNEANGRIIEAANSTGIRLFKQVTPKALKSNPSWKDNVVTVWENGQQKRYVTTPLWADIMRIDPYYVGTGLPQIAFAAKRLVEELNTGFGNPMFAITSFLRNWQIGKFTTPPGRVGVGLARSVYAIPRVLAPLALRNLAQSIDASLARGAGNWWSALGLTPGVRQNLSTLMAQGWHNSWLSHMEEHGPYSSTYITQQTKLQLPLMNKLLGSLPDGARSTWRALMTTLYTIHGAPQAAYVMRNLARVQRRGGAAALDRETRYIVAEGRALTGDARTGGQGYLPTFGGKGVPMRDIPQAGSLRKTSNSLFRGAAELGRDAMPWFNVSLQGIKRIGQAYLENPYSFVARAWLYSVAPTTAIYLWNKHLGDQYTDYQMRGRSQWQQNLSHYIGIPGKPPEEGLEFPTFHEMSLVKRMTEILLHHGMTSTYQMFTKQEDLTKAAQQFMQNVILPAPFATEGMLEALKGNIPGQQLLDPSNSVDQREFTQPGVIGPYYENLMRTFGGAIGNMVGTGYAAFNADPGDFMHRLNSGLKEVKHTAIARTPILKTIVDQTMPMSRDTDLNREYRAKKAQIDKLVFDFSHFGKYWLSGQEPQIVTKPGSKAGLPIARELEGGRPIGELNPGAEEAPYPGGLPSPPTNPLYKLFMQRVYANFTSDNGTDKAPVHDIEGFDTLMSQRGDLTTAIASMRKVNYGNMEGWFKRVNENPVIKSMLGGLDPKDRNSPVKAYNFLVKRAAFIERRILISIKQVEKEMSKEAMRPITLENLDPYGKPPALSPGYQ